MAVNRRLAVLVLHLGALLARPAAAASQTLADDHTSFAEPSVASEMSRLPQNLEAAQTLVPVLRAMRERSRTFRSQCARIERTRSLQLVLRWGQAPQRRNTGGRAEIVTLNGRTRAEVVVGRELDSSQLVEVIAHEFEHVVEQLDGVRLTGRAQQGVTRDRDGNFETARATRIGQTVAHEMRRFGNPSSDRH
jgi:hypothetical protein